jgi:radical SAM superfamily enzyme
MSFSRLDRICDLVHQYLPRVKIMTMAARVDNVKNKTVEELRILREKGMVEVNLGVESGDDWTLERINKGYHAADILEQCAKLDEAGIAYWMTFLNGVAGREHSHEHALHSAEIFSQCHPTVVGTGGLTLFPGTPLLEEARRGEFDPLTEKEMLEELKLFAENLTCHCSFITHHTISGVNLSGPDFLFRKDKIIAAIEHEIQSGDLDRMAAYRRNKRTL